MAVKPQGPIMIATVVVVTICYWMIMLAAIGLGATHVGACPVQPNIPIYLIVLGAASILSLCLTYSIKACDDGAVRIINAACMVLLHIFTFGWFIAGTSWVYAVYPPNYSLGTDRYCHKITYQFAFVVTTLLWVAMAFMFICSCCFALLTCCRTIVATRHLIPSHSSFYGATNDFEEPPAGDV